jgi:hypothetical protein
VGASASGDFEGASGGVDAVDCERTQLFRADRVDRDEGDDESLERAVGAVDEPAQLVIAQASGQVVDLAQHDSAGGIAGMTRSCLRAVKMLRRPVRCVWAVVPVVFWIAARTRSVGKVV